MKRKIKAIILILIIGICFILFSVFYTYANYSFHARSGSMHPTIMVKDEIIINRMSYLFTNPQRWDMVLLEKPEGELIVKRVIGLPNEIIQIINNGVFINNEKLLMPANLAKVVYLKEGEFIKNNDPIKTLDNQYFIMGDYVKSIDSRSFGLVSRDEIVGKVTKVIRGGVPIEF